jgi:DNA-binding helix-hairpin-helix protein with protein kinase domain
VVTSSGDRAAGFRLSGGDDIELGPVLARAGEGLIHSILGHPDLVAKIFHSTLHELESKLDKVAAMVASQPHGATQDDGFFVLTWPMQLIRRDHRPAGYAMARIDTSNAVEIHTLSNPSNRARPLPSAPQWPADVTWGHLLTVAANLCLAVEVVHRVDAVIGDFQERNILVSDSCRVTLVDCDSMQFTDAAGRVFLCGSAGRSSAPPSWSAPICAAVHAASHRTYLPWPCTSTCC